MDETENSNTNAFDLFVSECSDVDIEVRLNSIQRLSTVAVALGVEKTKAELIPYLESLPEGIFNDDEVLLHLAEQLGRFLPFVGGTENANLILNILEKLASIDENVVRERAVDSLLQLATLLDITTLENIFVPLVLRLAESEWFTSKNSGTALFPVCYPKASADIKTDLRNAYRVLCQDESPLVRRSAAARLTEFVKVLELPHLKDEFIPVFDNFSKDDQDSVRVLAVDVGISIASRLKKKEVEEFLLATLTELCGDASWRVRYQVAFQINSIQLALGHELTRKYLVPIFENIVHDSESQVREAAAKGVVRFCQILQQTFKDNDQDINDTIDPTILNQIFPLIQYLDQDISPEVKEALSTVITSLSPLLGVENTRNFLLPLITSSLLNDSSRVRENIISNLNNIISVIGISDIADTVLKIVIDLVNNSASVWRTRRNLIVTINYMAKQSGKEYFDTHLKVLYQKLLSDGVYAVRKTAPLILPILVKSFGFAWARKSVVPLFLLFAEHKHYLYRFVCLFCIDEFVTPTLEAKFESAGCSKNRFKYLQACNNADVTDEEQSLLGRLKKLNGILKTKLQEQWVLESLRNLEENYVSDDDIKRYAEDTIEMFLRDNNIDIMSVSKEELAQKDVYLEGVLGLILNEFLRVLRSLTKDPVPNIQLKVARTLSKMVEFNRSLEGEFEEAWAEEALKDYRDVTMEEIGLSSMKVEENKKQSEEVTVEKCKDVEEHVQTQTVEEENVKMVTEVVENKIEELGAKNLNVAKEKSMETELIEILEEKLTAEKTES